MKRKKYSPSDVRYTPGDEYLQSLLRLALYDAWDGRCHWCGDGIPNPAAAEIDHIIPDTRYELFKKQDDEALKNVYRKKFRKRLMTLPDSPHEVLNLAPICSRHNQKKGNSLDQSTLGAIESSLKDARKAENRVIKSVMAMTRAKGLSKSFVDLIALPADKETASVVKQWGVAVVSSLWRYDKPTVERFRIPRDLSLDLSAGPLPDWMAQATESGDGIDSRLMLTLDEQAAIEGAVVLFEFDDFADKLSIAFSSASEEADAEVTGLLVDRGVTYPDDNEPRWTRVEAQVVTGTDPELIVIARTTASIGGSAVVGADADGRPRMGHRYKSFESVITCRTDFASGEFEYTYVLKFTDEDEYDGEFA